MPRSKQRANFAKKWKKGGYRVFRNEDEEETSSE